MQDVIGPPASIRSIAETCRKVEEVLDTPQMRAAAKVMVGVLDTPHMRGAAAAMSAMLRSEAAGVLRDFMSADPKTLTMLPPGERRSFPAS